MADCWSLAFQTENQTSVAVLVVFRLHDAARALGDAGPFADRQNLVGLSRCVDVEHGDRLAAIFGFGIQGSVDPQVLGLRDGS